MYIVIFGSLGTLHLDYRIFSDLESAKNFINFMKRYEDFILKEFYSLEEDLNFGFEHV